MKYSAINLYSLLNILKQNPSTCMVHIIIRLVIMKSMTSNFVQFTVGTNKNLGFGGLQMWTRNIQVLIV